MAKMTRLERFKSINRDDSFWIWNILEPWIDRTWLEFQMKHDRKLFAIIYMEKLVGVRLDLYILGSDSNKKSEIRKRECILIKSQFSFLHKPMPILALQDLFNKTLSPSLFTCNSLKWTFSRLQGNPRCSIQCTRWRYYKWFSTFSTTRNGKYWI